MSVFATSHTSNYGAHVSGTHTSVDGSCDSMDKRMSRLMKRLEMGSPDRACRRWYRIVPVSAASTTSVDPI